MKTFILYSTQVANRCACRRPQVVVWLLCALVAGASACTRIGFDAVDAAAPDAGIADLAPAPDRSTPDRPTSDMLPDADLAVDALADASNDTPRDSGMPDGVPTCDDMHYTTTTLAGSPGTNATPVTLPFGTGAIELNRRCVSTSCETVVRQLNSVGQALGAIVVAADMLSDPPGGTGDAVVFFSNFMHSAAYVVQPSTAGSLSVAGPVSVGNPKTGWTGTWFPSVAGGPGELGIFHVSFDSKDIGLYLTRLKTDGLVLERDRLVKPLTTNSGGVQAPGWDGKRYVAIYKSQIVFADGTTEVPLVLAGGESVRSGYFVGDGFVLFTSQQPTAHVVRVGMDGLVSGRVTIGSNASAIPRIFATRLADGRYLLSWTLFGGRDTKPPLSVMVLDTNFKAVAKTTLSNLIWPSVADPPQPFNTSYELLGYGLVPQPTGLLTVLHLMVEKNSGSVRNLASEIAALRLFCP